MNKTGIGQATPPPGNDYVAIAAGWEYSLALRQDGSIVCWGNNQYGQATPPPGNDYIAITAGGEHCLALKQDSSIVGWGAGTEDLGEFPHYGQATPPEGSYYVAIAAGDTFSLAIAGCQRYAPACDLNDDCKVDYLDLEIMAGDWLASEADLVADINTDSVVDMKDYAILADMWLQ